MDNVDEIMALLEEDFPVFEEELVDGVMQIREQDIIGVDSGVISESTYLQSVSAHSVTSSSAVVSNPDDLSAIGFDQFSYLMEASDEELGLPPQPASRASSTEFEVGDADLVMQTCNWLENSGLLELDCLFNEMVNFLLDMQGDWAPFDDESLNMDDESLNMDDDLLGMQVDW